VGGAALIGAYQKTVSALLDRRGAGNADLAAEIASVPEHIRGFGHVKEAHCTRSAPSWRGCSRSGTSRCGSCRRCKSIRISIH